MNLLILSAGTRNKVVQYFKKECGKGDKIIATDCSNLAPAVYDADKFYLVPRINHPDYLNIILDICKKESVDGVLSLIDPELSLISKHRDDFAAVGTTVIVPDYDLVEICFDKYKMYQKLCELGIPTGKCYMEKEEFYAEKQKGNISASKYCLLILFNIKAKLYFLIIKLIFFHKLRTTRAGAYT